MSGLEDRLRSALQDETIELSARHSLADDMVQRGTTLRRRRRLAGGVAGLALLAAVVPVWRSIDTSPGSTGPVQQPTVTSQTTRTTSTGTASPPPVKHLLPRFASARAHVVKTPSVPPTVVNVRAARHSSYDRVVIDFDGAMAGYTVERAPVLYQDASGKRMHVPGTAILVVRLTPAAAHTGAGSPTLQAPNRQAFDFPILRGVVLAGDFEGHVSFGIGLDHASTFRVFELKGPNRLVIDLRH